MLTYGQSLFGASDKTIGFLQSSYSAAGEARSYEIASTDSLQVNPQNFSLWTNLAFITYSINVGYDGASATDADGNDYYSDLANLKGAFLGIPLQNKKIVFGFGLQPISKIDRRFADKLSTDSPETESLYLKGGLGRAVANLSYRPVNFLGISVGYELTFGTIGENYIIDYEDISVYRIEVNKKSSFSGHGLVISSYVKPVKNLTFGIISRFPVKTDVKIKRTSSSNMINETQNTTITLPAKYGIGMEYILKPRLKIGADFLYQDWEQGYKIESEKVDTYQDKFYRFGMGIERTQSKQRFTNLTEQMDFRAGLFYGNLNQTSKNNSVTEYGISFGFSLPVIRFISTLDVSGKIGRRGDTSKNAFQETFYSLGITFSATELWFVNIDD